MERVKRFVTIIMMFCFMFLFSGVAEAGNIITVPVTVKEDYSEASAFIAYLNEQRVSAGKSPYAIDSGLMELAMQRTAETCVYWGHCGPSNIKESGITQYIRGTALYDSVYVDENIAVGLADGRSAYTVWYNSTSGHKYLLTGNEYHYCGVGCVVYNNTTYWVLITSDIPYGGVISAPTGTKTVTRSVQVETSLLDTIRSDWTGGTYHYGESYDKAITCLNKGDTSGVAGGYRIEDPSYLKITNNCTDIIQMDSLGRVKTVGTGSGTVTVSVAGNTPTTISFIVEPQNARWSNISLDKTSYAYTGNAITPKPVVVDYHGVTLTEGLHYTLSYENNILPYSTTYTYATVKVTFIHSGYEGGRTVNFMITGTVPDNSASSDTGASSGGNASNGSTGTSDNTNSSSGSSSSSNNTNTSSGSNNSSNNTSTGTASGSNATGNNTSTGTDNSSGTTSANTSSGTTTTNSSSSTSKTKTFTKVKLSKTSYTYTGKTLKPSVTVYMGKKKLAAKYYTVKYTNNKNVGTATVTVTGKSTYKGYKSTATYKINLPKMTFSSLKSSKKKTATVKWKKSTQSGGYEIQYSTNKKFKSGVHSVKVSGAKKTSYTLKKLTSKKTYYVRIRAYKKVSGKYWYSAWTGTKKVKVK